MTKKSKFRVSSIEKTTEDSNNLSALFSLLCPRKFKFVFSRLYTLFMKTKRQNAKWNSGCYKRFTNKTPRRWVLIGDFNWEKDNLQFHGTTTLWDMKDPNVSSKHGFPMTGMNRRTVINNAILPRDFAFDITNAKILYEANDNSDHYPVFFFKQRKKIPIKKSENVQMFRVRSQTPEPHFRNSVSDERVENCLTPQKMRSIRYSE